MAVFPFSTRFFVRLPFTDDLIVPKPQALDVKEHRRAVELVTTPVDMAIVARTHRVFVHHALLSMSSTTYAASCTRRASAYARL